jgi:regulator of cell morphogenesis and NO signaling
MAPEAPEDAHVRHPIDQLLAEHREILAEVESLRTAVRDLRDRGDAALPTALPALQSVGRMMATRLLQHARKEDEALFPALERVFGAIDSPTAVMREEHRAIHDRARLFRDTLRELNEVEHPAIVAGGATLRALAVRGENAAALADTGEEIVNLLDLHFGKEQDILFPMARTMLSDDEMAEVERRMAAIEETRE